MPTLLPTHLRCTSITNSPYQRECPSPPPPPSCPAPVHLFMLAPVPVWQRCREMLTTCSLSCRCTAPGPSASRTSAARRLAVHPGVVSRRGSDASRRSGGQYKRVSKTALRRDAPPYSSCWCAHTCCVRVCRKVWRRAMRRNNEHKAVAPSWRPGALRGDQAPNNARLH